MKYDLKPGTGAYAGWIEARCAERPGLVRFARTPEQALAAIRAAVADEDARRASAERTAKE